MERKDIEGDVRVQSLRNALKTLGRPLDMAITQLLRWRQLSRDRAELARLSDDRLRDIGLSRADARRESSRPFWDDPLKR